MTDRSVLDSPRVQYARTLTRDMGPWGRLLMATVIAINGFAFLFVVPGWIGVALGAPFLVVAGAIVVGQAIREFEIRFLGRGRGPGGEP